MTISDILRYNRHLALYKGYNLNERLQRIDPSLFLAYNKMKGVIELHSVKSWKYNKESHNATIPTELISGYIINDYKANNHEKFGDDLKEERKSIHFTYDKWEEKSSERNAAGIKMIERTLGRRI